MKNLIALALFALMAATGIANAADVKDKGAYMGLAIGQSDYNLNDIEDLVVDLGADVDSKDTGFQLWGGYKFFRWFAVEGKYSHLGQWKATGDGGTVKAEVGALTGSAVFIAPFGASGFDFYGQVGLGLASWELKGDGKVDGTEPVGTAGLGFRWTINQTFTLSLGLDAFAFEAEDEGEKEDIDVVITKLGIQYNF